MIKVKDGYAKLIGVSALGAANQVLLSNGGNLPIGNAEGNIPLNNSTVNTNLNADLLDGKHNGELTAVALTRVSGGTLDANNLSNTNYLLKFYSAIASNSTNIPTYTGYLNALLEIPLHHNGVTAQLYFSATKALFYRSMASDTWNQIAYTTSDISGNAASATKLQTARKLWGLSFDGTADVNGKIYLNDWDTDGIAIRLDNSNKGFGYLSFYTALSNAYTVGQNGSSFLIRHNTYGDIFNILNGNVGIGTTSPTSKLHIKGIATIDGPVNALLINHTHTLSTAWNDFIRCLNPNLTSTYHTAHITFGKTYNSKNTGYIGFTYVGNASNSNMVTIGLHSVDNILNVLASGNVGIGTTAPSARLHVVSSALTGVLINSSYNPSGVTRGITIINSNLAQTISAGVALILGKETTNCNTGHVAFRNIGGLGSTSNYITLGLFGLDNILNIVGTRNVGIDITAPEQKLHILGLSLLSQTANGNLYYLVRGLTYHIGFGLGGGGINRGIYDFTDGSWMLYRDATTNMLIPKGNVGIGTTNPSYKLHVEGNIYATSTNAAISINRTGTYASEPCIGYYNAGTNLGSIGVKDYNTPFFWNASTSTVYTIWHSGNDGSGSGLDADLLDGYQASSFVFHRKYSSLSALPSGSNGWYKIATINDTSGSPCIFMVRAYAHSSAIFTVSKGYSTSGNITQLQYCASVNGSYCYVLGARILSDGTVEILLNKPSANNSTYVNISIAMFNPNNVKLNSTLTLDSSSPTVIQSMTFINTSMQATHFYESSDINLKTNIKSINSSDNIPLLKEFNWKSDDSHSYGLIALELEQMGYPELVSGEDGSKTVKYSAALSLIVGKLQVKIKELEKEIEILKNKINIF